MLREFWNQNGWLALIPLAIAGLALWAWIGIGSEARDMARSGIETTGTVVDTRRILRPTSTGSGTGLSYSYFATVMFTSGSAIDDSLEVHQIEHFVDKDYHDTTRVGDRVWLRHLPDNPERIELVPGGTKSNANAAGWVGLGMAIIGLLAGWLFWGQAAKVHRLRTAGHPVQATITKVIKQNSWTILSLTLPDGREAKALPVKADTGTYSPGGTVTVLAEPSYPAQVLIAPTARTAV